MLKILIATALTALVLAGCKFQTCWAGGDWRLCYSKEVALQKEDGKPVIIMAGNAEPHYLVRPQGNISGNQRLIVRYKVEVLSGTPTIKATDCTTKVPGAIAAFFQRSGDDMMANGNMQYYRWWSKQRPKLEVGEHVLTVSLKASDDEWGSVYSKTSAGSAGFFNKAKESIRQIGVTFGGCEGAGHGINVVDGTMKITILDLKVE